MEEEEEEERRKQTNKTEKRMLNINWTNFKVLQLPAFINQMNWGRFFHRTRLHQFSWQHLALSNPKQLNWWVNSDETFDEIEQVDNLNEATTAEMMRVVAYTGARARIWYFITVQ